MFRRRKVWVVICCSQARPFILIVIRKTAWARLYRAAGVRESGRSADQIFKMAVQIFRARLALPSRKPARPPSLCQANMPGNSPRRSIQRTQSGRGELQLLGRRHCISSAASTSD